MSNQSLPVKLIVMMQCVGHVVNAEGSVSYRAVEIDLTDEQAKKLRLRNEYEDYATFAIYPNRWD